MNMKFDRITYMKKTNNILEIRFSSIEWARKAYGMFKSLKTYRNCTPFFVPDPCAQSLEILQGQRMAYTAAVETVSKHAASAASPEAQLVAEIRSGRLNPFEWQCEAEHIRGRGFKTQS